VAEELDVALESVDMVMGDTDLCPWDVGTFGSLNIWQFGPVLRAAAPRLGRSCSRWPASGLARRPASSR